MGARSTTRLWLFGLLLVTACRRGGPVGDAGLPAPREPEAARRGAITDYRVAFALRGAQVVLRTFTQAGRAWALVVDPQTLVTEVVPATPVTPVTLDALAASPWTDALRAARQHEAALQDSGLTHLLPAGSGVVLTVDLCPSHRHFDFRITRELLDVFGPEERPVPVAFSVSGVWLVEHEDDLAKLKALDGNALAITWINHSMHHRYAPGAPLTRNFLLEPGTDARREVLDAEVAMLEHGLTPSVFFRFPGLVSEPALVELVSALGLISVGSDAWLAKGERPGPGSVVLIHGNGNEPRGVDDFLALVRQEKKAIARRQFLLLDLREGVRETER
ncbi:MAG: polysaccharide deacetylase [Myxococcota bacterium]